MAGESAAARGSNGKLGPSIGNSLQRTPFSVSIGAGLELRLQCPGLRQAGRRTIRNARVWGRHVSNEKWLGVLQSLLGATSAADVRAILLELGDHAGANLEDAFGDSGLRWRVFGDNSSNISSIGLGSKSGLPRAVSRQCGPVLLDF